MAVFGTDNTPIERDSSRKIYIDTTYSVSYVVYYSGIKSERVGSPAVPVKNVVVFDLVSLVCSF